MNKKYIDFVPSSRARGVGSRVVAPRGGVVREIREEDVVVALPNAEQVSRTRVVRTVKRGISGADNTLGIDEDTRNTGGARDIDRFSDVDGVMEKKSARGKVVVKHREEDAFSLKSGLKLGVVEDYNPKFVNTNVSKRPLHNESASYTSMAEATGAALMSQGKKEVAQAKTQRVKRGLLGRRGKEVASRDSSLSTTQEDVRKDSKASFVTKKAAKTGLLNTSEAMSDTRREAKTSRAKTGLIEERNRKVSSSTAFAAPRSPFINQDKVVKRPLSSRNVYQKPVAKEEKKGPVTIITNSEKDSKVGLLVTIILTIVLGAAAGTVAFLLLPK